MSDRTTDATPGVTSGTDEGASTPEVAGGSTLGRMRNRLSEAGASVTSKVSELRPQSGDRGDSVAQAASTGAQGAVQRPASAGSGSGAVAATSSGMVGTSAVAPTTRRTRKARLRLSRLDPWSVMKTALLFSVAGAIIFFIATWVVWGVINASGVFSSVNNAVNDLVASPTSTTKFRLEDYVNTHRVLGLTALIGAIDAVLFTALATLFSFLYNLAASVMGGLEVTLAED